MQETGIRLVSASMEATSYLLLGIAIVILAYVVVRVGSFAYFRTKLEYLRNVLRELNGGDNRNG